MSTVICLLRLTSAERDAFRKAWPQAQFHFAPVESQNGFADMAPFAPLADDVEVILGCPQPSALASFPRLKWLQTWTAGVDPYLAPGVLPQGAALTSAVGAYGPAVAEHMLSCTLSLMKRLPTYHDDQRQQVWQDRGGVASFLDATVVLLGTGDIGGHYAAYAKALGAHTIGLNRHPDKPIPAMDELRHISELDGVLPRADVVAMSLPGTPETTHIMDAHRLGLMKPTAILVNAGRGTAVDALALADALGAGKLWGAALDVTEPEPLPPGYPLWSCPGLLLTPHVAGGDHMDATCRRIAAIALDNVGRYVAGQPLNNPMN